MAHKVSWVWRTTRRHFLNPNRRRIVWACCTLVCLFVLVLVTARSFSRPEPGGDYTSVERLLKLPDPDWKPAQSLVEWTINSTPELPWGGIATSSSHVSPASMVHSSPETLCICESVWRCVGSRVLNCALLEIPAIWSPAHLEHLLSLFRLLPLKRIIIQSSSSGLHAIASAAKERQPLVEVFLVCLGSPTDSVGGADCVREGELLLRSGVLTRVGALSDDSEGPELGFVPSLYRVDLSSFRPPHQSFHIGMLRLAYQILYHCL